MEDGSKELTAIENKDKNTLHKKRALFYGLFLLLRPKIANAGVSLFI